MPPDRNSLAQSRDLSVDSDATTADAKHDGPRKLSHAAKHTPSLERGKACLTCRSRKVKCDGAVPACNSCRKSAVAKGEDPATIVCDYDTPEQRKRPVGGGKVWGLEAKIAQLEQRISELQQENEQQKTVIAAAGLAEQAQMHFGGAGMATRPSATHSAEGQRNSGAAAVAPELPPLPPVQPVSTTANDLVQAPFNAATVDPLGQQLAPPSIETVPDFDTSGASLQLPDAMGPFAGPRSDKPYGDISNHTYFAQSFAVRREHFPTPTPLNLPQQSPLLELFYPGWPRTLPSPQLVHRLVEAFFTKSHLVSVMINKPRLMRNLQLPPTHPDFPTTALLHGVIAVASDCVSDDVWQGEERYWSAEESPAEWHARQAKMGVESAWVNDDHYLEVAQTAVLCCFLSYQNARFGEVWLECAQATRLAVPLGINHLRSSGVIKRAKWQKHLKTSMLQPTEDESDLFERSITFWFAFTCDRFASASTGWATSLDEEDVTTLLPAPPGNKYPTENLNESPLSVHNPHFLTSHPTHLVQTLQLYLKSVVLMGRVVTFLQRSASAIGVGPNNGKRNLTESPFASIDPRESVLFKQLDSDLTAFRNSIPRQYQHVSLQAHSDALISLVHAIPHASTILLHEPFVTMAETDPSMVKCVASARAILETIFTLYSSSFELSLLVPFINFTWAVAGRTLVRELALKQVRKQTKDCDELRSSVNTIIAAMKSGRSKLGESTSQALEALLQCPSACLPAVEVKHHGFGFAPVIDASGQTIFVPSKSADPRVPSEALRFFIERPKTPVQNMADMDPWMTNIMASAAAAGNGSSNGPTSDYDSISQFLMDAEATGQIGSLDSSNFGPSPSAGTSLGPSPLGLSSVSGATTNTDATSPADSFGGSVGVGASAGGNITFQEPSPPFLGGARITEMEDVDMAGSSGSGTAPQGPRKIVKPANWPATSNWTRFKRV
ncbi:hypothetical protein OIV83_002890 [Microbotryomycetes sp. JL201]|nr:hypothetical protein OIV83_002890 [Microbotryomycetes sp. JL201]